MKSGLIALRLFARGLKYYVLRVSGFSSKIEALSIEVTRRCIAKCIMCNIWKTPSHIKDLPLSEWLGLLRSPLFTALKELDITGGEPFLRDDLSQLILGVCDLTSHNLRKLKTIAVTTNGFLTDKILITINHTIKHLQEHNIDLVLALAMDGIGNTHDRIRRVKNGWDSLNETIERLTEVRNSYPNLILGLKNTIVPVNVSELDQILEYAEEHALFTITSPFIVTENRYNNVDREEDLRFTEDDRAKIMRFYESPRFKWSYHRDMLSDYLQKGFVKKPCSAGFNYLFIRSNGDVFPCPLINWRLGNFTESPIEELINSKKARSFKRKITTYDACHSCTEPGLERYALPFEGFHYLALLLKLGPKRFLDLHHHMGMEKYI